MATSQHKSTAAALINLTHTLLTAYVEHVAHKSLRYADTTVQIVSRLVLALLLIAILGSVVWAGLVLIVGEVLYRSGWNSYLIISLLFMINSSILIVSIAWANHLRKRLKI